MKIMRKHRKPAASTTCPFRGVCRWCKDLGSWIVLAVWTQEFGVEYEGISGLSES